MIKMPQEINFDDLRIACESLKLNSDICLIFRRKLLLHKHILNFVESTIENRVHQSHCQIDKPGVVYCCYSYVLLCVAFVTMWVGYVTAVNGLI